MKSQIVIPFLPGYMFDGHVLVSTGAAISPSQIISPHTGEIMYYVRPLFNESGSATGMYIRHQGIIDWINGQT